VTLRNIATAAADPAEHRVAMIGRGDRVAVPRELFGEIQRWRTATAESVREHEERNAAARGCRIRRDGAVQLVAL
jgi:hypothetical protein